MSDYADSRKYDARTFLPPGRGLVECGSEKLGTSVHFRLKYLQMLNEVSFMMNVIKFHERNNVCSIEIFRYFFL